MKISGVLVFEDLTEDEVEMAHEFQYSHWSLIRFLRSHRNRPLGILQQLRRSHPARRELGKTETLLTSALSLQHV